MLLVGYRASRELVVAAAFCLPTRQRMKGSKL